MIVSDDMVDGYLAGLKSYSVELPACHMNKSAAFRHGWISGRNDRYPELAERFDVRKRRAEMILFTAAKPARPPEQEEGLGHVQDRHGHGTAAPAGGRGTERPGRRHTKEHGGMMTLKPAARRADPVTSHIAAADHTLSGKRSHHIGIVIDAVRRHPGKTSAELAPICGLERHEVARRTADAEHAGAIRKGEIRRCNTSGRSAVTWWPA